ncbi:MAG TPA: STAS domain-containing protein [Gemmatimonadaceae bacterium]|nr:STAS domain-containing protein [Gemmatimonadaceae bacterium]
MMYIAEAQPAAVLVAPSHVTAENRLSFRRQALEYLERASQAKTAFVVDLRATNDIDASGLGILVLLQKRAREYGLVTRLVGPSPAVREALRGARLDYLFEIMD